MGKKLKKEVAVPFRRKVMAVLWMEKKGVCMLGRVLNEEMQNCMTKLEKNESQKCALITVVQWAVLTFLISTLRHKT
jgi:hypothetical protein